MKYLQHFLGYDPFEKSGDMGVNLPTKPTKPPEAETDLEGVDTGGGVPTKPTKPPPAEPAPLEITIPPDYRNVVASWPHERWVAWRRRSLELQGQGPTADAIRAADRAAYDELASPTA